MTIGRQALASKNKNNIIQFLELPYEQNGLKDMYTFEDPRQPYNPFNKTDWVSLKTFIYKYFHNLRNIGWLYNLAPCSSFRTIGIC